MNMNMNNFNDGDNNEYNNVVEKITKDVGENVNGDDDDNEYINFNPKTDEEDDDYASNISMVIDVEAVVIQDHKVNILEQIGFVLINERGNEIMSGKFLIRQLDDKYHISKKYKIPLHKVERSIYFYEKITRDGYIHIGNDFFPQKQAIKEIIRLSTNMANVTYAKGCKLENEIFQNAIQFTDLEWYNCPKYPYEIHDPLLECRFFSKFIPSQYKESEFMKMEQSTYKQCFSKLHDDYIQSLNIYDCISSVSTPLSKQNYTPISHIENNSKLSSTNVNLVKKKTYKQVVINNPETTTPHLEQPIPCSLNYTPAPYAATWNGNILNFLYANNM
jgi:hypothetical protein